MQKDDKLLEDFKDLLKKKGMKFTEQRAIILQILFSIDGHLNAEEVHDVVKRDYPDSNIGIATVYRTLGFLEEANLITSISFGTDGKKYEGNKKKHHDHLICTKCGKIVEFMDNEIEMKQEQIAKKNGFDITSHNMQIFGICSDCQKK